MYSMLRRPARATSHNADVRRCLIVGAGAAGRSLARDLKSAPEFGLCAVGFLDDDRTLGRSARSFLPVLGSISDMSRVARTHHVEFVVIAIPSLPSAEIRRIGETAASAGLSVRYLPSFVAALEREVRATDLRHLNVDHLLGRRELNLLRPASRSVVEGKRVLVTGAGGSIGSELCRQIRGFDPSRLFLLDHDESNLHRLQMELTGAALLDDDDMIIADIRDGDRMTQLFEELRPEVVFHAAAHKHLPLLERHPCEGVKSNVLGTLHLVEASIAVGVERFILISTDKAADPTSVLGATKRVAEMIVRSRRDCHTRLAAVRFGNVLGSRGSLLSVISEQLANGEPVTITAPDVTRFFMTIQEAASLVIEAGAMADFGEIFVLDMGEPVGIVDLVKSYARELHLDADRIDIRFTGLRPGEKMAETLHNSDEGLVATAHRRISAAVTEQPVPDSFSQLLTELIDAAATNTPASTRLALERLIPGYVASSRSEMPQLAMAASAPYPDGF